jgi:hypothetical protein
VSKLQVELEDQVATNANQATINGQIVNVIKVKLDTRSPSPNPDPDPDPNSDP